MAYNPQIPPQTNEDLLPYLSDEFLRVAQALNNSLEGLYEIRGAIPDKRKAGMVCYFDGKGANPTGQGEGLYRYTTANTWVYIG